MCKKCFEAAARHYPRLSKRHRKELLWSATCFPFGTPEQVEKQLIEAKAAVGSQSLKGAIAYADQQITEAMKRCETINKKP